MKKFMEWLGLKEHLHGGAHQPPHVSVGDIWWVSLGENVGSEIDGKNELFSRPVIIYKKLAHGFYFTIPTTTKTRVGTWYVSVRHQEKDMAACLHQVRTIDYRRLSSKLGTLDDADMIRVKEGFNNLYR